jgi:hypothetical protein
MSIWMVIWVVLMMFWFFFGAWYGYDAPDGPARMGRLGGTFIPFLCVLLLGLMYFGALSGGGGGTVIVR